MVKRGGNIVLNSYDDLFETQQSKEDAGKEKVDMDKVTIKPDVLKKFKEVRMLSEKVMNIKYLPEKSFDNEEKLDIIKVKYIISKL